MSKPLYYNNLDLYYIKPENIKAEPTIIRITPLTFGKSLVTFACNWIIIHIINNAPKKIPKKKNNWKRICFPRIIDRLNIISSPEFRKNPKKANKKYDSLDKSIDSSKSSSKIVFRPKYIGIIPPKKVYFFIIGMIPTTIFEKITINIINKTADSRPVMASI